MAVKRALTHRLTLWIHTINVNLQSNVPIYITTVTNKQQKLSNVVNLKCKIYLQAFNVASNKNTYRFQAIHQYIIPIHVYITPMWTSIITKILLKATILSPLTALILPCKGKLTITHLLMVLCQTHSDSQARDVSAPVTPSNTATKTCCRTITRKQRLLFFAFSCPPYQYFAKSQNFVC